jgi:hypothetical protein
MHKAALIDCSGLVEEPSHIQYITMLSLDLGNMPCHVDAQQHPRCGRGSC